MTHHSPCETSPIPSGIDAVSLRALTIRQLIGLLADTEDQARLLHRPADPARRTPLRGVLRAPHRVLGELHRRHPCPTW